MQVLDDIAKKKFCSLSFSEKLSIVSNGKPCPELPLLKTVHKTKTEVYTRHFSTAHYKSVDWLTGCEKRNKLFCWPCFLFSSESNVWSRNGFDDLKHFSTAVQRHEKTKSHVQCFFQLKMFGRQRVDVLLNDQLDKSISQHNELVKKNRDILKRLIDAVCFLGKQELPFRGHDECNDSFNRGNYLEFLDALQQYDPLLEHHLQSSTVFRGTSPAVQNDLIQAISEVLIDEIKKEVHVSNFAAILLDESCDITCKSQLSTVLRYVLDGVVYERFVGLTDVSQDRTSEGLFKHVVSTVQEYKLKDKLVGQTYDGASVMAGHLDGLQKKVIDVYPKALFTHCCAHALNLVLQQSLMNIKDCNIFFQTLNGLSAFFSKSSKRTIALQEILSKKLPTVAPTRWNFTSRLVHTVNDHWLELIDFFENVIDCSLQWDADTVVKSQGFLSFLRSLNTIFLLQVFSRLFAYTDVLYNLLQTRNFDILYCCQKIEEIKNELQRARDTAFNEIWYAALGRRGEEFESPTNKRRRGCIGKDACCQLYFEIIDNISVHTETRFAALKKLEYFHLLYEQKYTSFKKNFPQDLIQKLKDVYGEMFDYVRLKNELVVLYCSDEFCNKSVHELLQFLVENDLSSGFKEVFKLAELIMTIPATTASVERSFSALKRIHSYRRSTQGQDRLSSLSLLSIEKELLSKVRMKNTFYDAVTEKFLQKERRIDLIFK
jgi:hypothetical protein